MVAVQINGVYFDFSGGDGSQGNPYTPGSVPQRGTWTVQPGNTINTVPWLTRLSDGVNNLSLLNLTNSRPVPTAIVDGSGNQITAFGGGQQYADGATQATPTGTALLWNDAGVVRVPSAAKPLPIRQLANTSTTAITTPRGIKTVASAGTPEALVGTSTLVQKVLILPQKAARTANAGVVYVDFIGTDDVQAIALSVDGAAAVLASSAFSLEAPAGKKIDLATIYVDVVTAGDGVYYLGID